MRTTQFKNIKKHINVCCTNEIGKNKDNQKSTPKKRVIIHNLIYSLIESSIRHCLIILEKN